MKIGKIILCVLGALFLLVLVSAGIDRVRNSRIETKPSRPKEKLEGSPNEILYRFETGQEFPAGELQTHLDGICSYVDGRYDCADFRLVSLMRVMYLHPEKLTESQKAQIRETLLNFKYWLDEPGDDSMCYWSENHQILFATAEYLAGKLYPDEIFPNTGMTGREHMAKGRERSLIWLEQRWNYGFVEWYSNVYYVEDIGPLSNLIDLTGDPEITVKAQIVMDLLLFDLATQSYKGTFVTTSGRAYERNRKSGVHSSMKSVAQHIWGYDLDGEDRKGMDLNFKYIRNYEVPEVIRQIGWDHGERIIKASNGLNVSELKGEDLIGMETRQIMMQWAMESFTNPEVIANTLKIINTYGLLSQESFNPFTMINYSVLKTFGLLPVISRTLAPQSNGNAIQRANAYMYKNDSFSMSTAQNYHPGTHGDQHHIWQATLSNELSIFASHPAVWPEDRGPNGNSPTYWVGSGRLPHSVQDRNVNLTLFRLPEEKGPMEKRMIPYTHAWFPEAHFDEVAVEDTHIFGRLGDVYVGMKAYQPLSYIEPERLTKDGDSDPEGRREVIQEGRDTWWITEISTREAEGGFDAFMERIRSNPASYSEGRLTYATGDREFELNFGGVFMLNGVPVDTEYDRFDSPYAEAPRKPETVTMEWNDRTLFLDFDNMIRREY